MEIAVLGTGMVGRAFAARLADLGHAVTVGTRDPAESRGREEIAAWLGGHPTVTLATFGDAAAVADVVVNASSGGATLAVLDLAGTHHLRGKVVVDISNPLDFSNGFPPTLSVQGDDSLAEQVQRAHPEARVVKALNTLTADLMVHPETLADGDHTIFVSGDDADAKATVTELLTSIGHTDVIDLGDLSTARGAEMFLPLWLRLMGALGTSSFNIKVVR